MQIEYIIGLSVVALWLLVLSIFFFRFFALFNKLTKSTSSSNLRKVLDKILEKGVANEKEITSLKKQFISLEEGGKLHVQKLGLVRFNPFKELGGDHSFALAILDGEDSGILITGLHSRDRTRIYMKSVKKGKPERTLSAEEQKALKVASKNKK